MSRAAQNAPQESCERALARFRVRALRAVPFYATLALHARVTYDPSVPLAATDGDAIILNPTSMNELDEHEFAFVIIHELMHLALRHVPRRKQRQPYPWNLVTDALINHTIDTSSAYHRRDSTLRAHAPEGVFTLTRLTELLKQPEDPAALAQRSAEELYALLRQHAPPPDEDAASSEADHTSNEKDDTPTNNHNALEPKTPDSSNTFTTRAWSDLRDDASRSDAERAESDAHWRRALANASALQREHESRNPGSTPAGLRRLIDANNDSIIDWRTLLWHHLSAYPHDYSSFDRRFLQHEQYLDLLDGQALTLEVCIDTSGSIDQQALNAFASELNGILNAYPAVRARLYYCDAHLDGPHDIETLNDAPPPVGGGGTSFRPFFEHLERDPSGATNPIAVYFTDGYGDFPEHAPSDHTTIWAVQPGGLESERFPFGEIVRIDPHA